MPCSSSPSIREKEVAYLRASDAPTSFAVTRPCAGLGSHRVRRRAHPVLLRDGLSSACSGPSVLRRRSEDRNAAGRAHHGRRLDHGCAHRGSARGTGVHEDRARAAGGHRGDGRPGLRARASGGQSRGAGHGVRGRYGVSRQLATMGEVPRSAARCSIRRGSSCRCAAAPSSWPMRRRRATRLQEVSAGRRSWRGARSA